MGVFVPPSSDDSSKGLPETDNAPLQGRIDDLHRIFGWNPSWGLGMWGPLVPAADEKLGLATLLGCQTVLGCLGFRKFYRMRKQPVYFNRFKTSFTKWSSLIFGILAVSFAGLEFFRLTTYDPWADEAKHYRKLAVKNGYAPSRWFGAISQYTPMTSKEWLIKLTISINYQALRLGLQKVEVDNDFKKLVWKDDFEVVDGKSQMASDTFGLYNAKIRQRNVETRRKMLAEELKNVNELNKAERLDAILEGSSDISYNEDYMKPHIQLGNHKIESDDEFDMVWLNFEPWDELKLETTYDVRLIPKVRLRKADEINEN